MTCSPGFRQGEDRGLSFCAPLVRATTPSPWRRGYSDSHLGALVPGLGRDGTLTLANRGHPVAGPTGGEWSPYVAGSRPVAVA